MAAGRQQKRYAPSGATIDQLPSTVADELYTRAVDIVFREHAERAKGLQSVYPTALFPPEHLIWSRADDEVPVWLYPGATGIGVFRDPIHHDITPASFLAPTGDNAWTSGSLNGIPVISNGRPWFWDRDVTNPMEDLPDWPATRRAGFMRPYKFHLIAGAIDEAGTLFEDQILFSDAAAPGNIPQFWTPAADNQAGSFEVGYTGGAVVDGFSLRGSFIIYKETSCYIMDFVGGSQVMAQRLLYPDIGVLARNCVADFNNNHYVLTDGDCIVHDGQNVASIADGFIRQKLFANISGEHVRASFVVPDIAKGDVWFCVPTEGSIFPNLAFIYNVLRGKWSVRDLFEQPQHIANGQVRLTDPGESWDSDPDPWDSDQTPWESGGPRINFYQLLQADPSPAPGDFLAVDRGNDRLGLPMTAELRKEKIRLAGVSRVTMVKAIRLETDGTPGSELLVSIAGTFREGEPDQYGPEVSYVIDRDEKVDVFSTGVFHSVRIRSEDPLLPEPWRVAAFTLEFEERGLY